MVDFRKIFEAFGLADGADKKVLVGPGVVGNAVSLGKYFMIAVAICVVALPSHPEALPPVLLTLASGFGVCLLAVVIYGHIHPDHALMEGSQLLELHRMQLGAKDPQLLEHSPPRLGGAPTPIDFEGDGNA